MDKSIFLLILFTIVLSVYFNLNPNENSSEVNMNKSNLIKIFTEKELDGEDHKPRYFSTENYKLYEYTTDYYIR